jgi:hypothetical protein
MEVKIKNIVRAKNTNEIYEVVNIIGELLICKPVNHSTGHKGVDKIGLPMKVDDVEVMMDEETDAFNLLFKKDPNEIS